MESIIAAAMQLGVGGLFGAMWWLERKERQQVEDREDRVLSALERAQSDRAALVQLVENNTRAITKLEVAVRSRENAA